MKKNQKKKALEYLKMKRCRFCRNTENLTIDHKIPLIQGGKNSIGNLQCLCRRCNGIKSGMTNKQVRRIWAWFMQIQRDREKNGAKLYNFIKDTF